ncbi:MAG: prepilin-type N-terminal cleavage/methylation domain-containing protein [Candidatus Muiribacteriota bacterium]
MKKKGITLVELMIVLAIAGVFIVVLYNFFIGSLRRQHYTSLKQNYQAESRFLSERFYMDVTGGHKILNASPTEMSIEIYTDIPDEAALEYTPTVEVVDYAFDSTNRIVTRTYKGKTRNFEHVKSIEFKYLGIEFKDKKFELKEHGTNDEIVGVVMNVLFQQNDEEHNKEPERFELLISAFLKTRNDLMRFGTKSPYGYFSSLEDSTF